MGKRTTMTTHDAEPEGRFWTHPAMVVTVGCLSVLALVGILVTAVFIVNQRQYNDCQRSHDDEVIVALGERGKASDTDRQAIRKIAQSTTVMIKEILNPQASQEAKLAAIQQWSEAQAQASDKLDEADQKRAQNPIPEPRHC